MRKNEHLGALVRINALQIALGDYLKAEEILKWAYEGEGSVEIGEVADEEDIEKRTDSFIELYLTPDDSITKIDARKFIKNYISKSDREIDYERVKQHIRQMRYSDFLQTVYWKGVALFVKERDGKACSICGSEIKLVAHHTSYENHGDEIHHLDDIQCICRNCHSRVHGKNEECRPPQRVISLLDCMEDGIYYRFNQLVRSLTAGGFGDSNAKAAIRAAKKRGFIVKVGASYTKHLIA